MLAMSYRAAGDMMMGIFLPLALANLTLLERNLEIELRHGRSAQADD